MSALHDQVMKRKKNEENVRYWCLSAQGKEKFYVLHHKVRKENEQNPKLSMRLSHPLQ